MSSKHSMNFYDLLGVSHDADTNAIEKAFRAISLTRHPDRANAATRPKSGGESSSEREAREKKNHERYVKIVEARDTLIDSPRRRAYDREQGINNPSANSDRRTKDYPSRSASQSESSKSKSKSRSDSKSDSKSKSKSTSKSTTESVGDYLTEQRVDSLLFEITCIDRMGHNIQDMLYTIESAVRRSGGPDFAETVSLLQNILRKSRDAKDDIFDAIGKLRSLGQSTPLSSEMQSRADRIYNSVVNGALDYMQRAEKTVEEFGLFAAELDQRWR